MTVTLPALDANLFVALDALLGELHVGRAARRVGLSPSAMSHALNRARGTLDDPLLVRAGRKMVPTPRAAAIAPLLREAVTLLSRAIERPRPLDPKSVRRTLRVAAVDFALNHVLQDLTRALGAEAPHVDLEVVPFSSRSFDDLRSGEIALGLAAHRPVAGFSSRVLMSEPFVCVVRRGHPLLAGRVTAKRFASAEHVMISPRGRTPGATDVALKRRGMKRRVALVMPTFLGAALAVSKSDLVLTCSARSADQVSRWLGLSTFEPPLKLEPFGVGMFWHARTEGDAFLEWLRARIAGA